jgi:hypothetical protein
MPEAEKPLPVSSSRHPEFPEAQVRLFREVLELLNRERIPYAVSGAFALQAHTGIWRDTKDLDLFLTSANVEHALCGLAKAGFRCEVHDPVWLAKAHRDSFFVDLITGMSNGLIVVDDSWIERSRPEVVMGIPSRVLGAEELIASKLFVTRRERFDGADIAHVVHGTRGKLDWDRLLFLVGDEWEVLLWSLLLFHYCYPMHGDYVPRRIWDDLLGRFQKQLRSPNGHSQFRGTLIDSLMFKIDVEEWGQPDLERQYREARTRIVVAGDSQQHTPECEEEPAA